MKHLSNHHKTYVWWLALFFSVLFGCSNPSGKYSEGVIQYNITYPNSKEKGFMASMLPGSMELDFKYDQHATILSAGMGMFETKYIVNSEDKELIHCIKLLGKKSVLYLNEKQVDSVLAKKPPFKVQYKNDTKTIAGFKCKHALVTTGNNPTDTFSVYYTNKIKMKDPYWCTPLKEIPGVMLEYQMKQKGMTMHFTASKITFNKVDPKVFSVSKDYNKLTPKAMDDLMTSIFSSFGS